MKLNQFHSAARRVVRLWFHNATPFLLAWGLSGLITVAAQAPECRAVDLGPFGAWLGFALGLDHLEFAMWAGVAYLVIGFLQYLAGYRNALLEAQRWVLEPLVVPAFFVAGGYLLGIRAHMLGQPGYWRSWVMALAMVLIATLLANIYAIVEWNLGRRPA